GEDGCDHSAGACTGPGGGNYNPDRDYSCRDSNGTLVQQLDTVRHVVDYVYGCVGLTTGGSPTVEIYRDNGYSNAPNVSDSNPRWTAPSNTFKGFLRTDPIDPELKVNDYVT